MLLGIGPEGWTAIFTGLLTVTTIGLFWATYGQLSHLRREFAATHRPEIVIHSAVHATVLKPGTASQAIGAGFTYFNKGTVPAKDVEICGAIVSVRFGGALSERFLAMPLVQSPGEPVVPGSPYYFDVMSDIGVARAAVAVSAEPPDGLGPHPELVLHCIGTISYSDSTGTRRQTGFCWRWNDRRWERVTDSSYEYAY